MYVKIHRSADSEVVAVCDKELIGKELNSGELFLKVSETFYKGKLKDKKEVKIILKEAKNLNLVGKESVGLGVELGLIDKENIIMFKNIPYAQALVL